MNSLKFSVVIPCYNASKWIEKALTSLESQNYKPLDVIVVDDGSTDDSIEVVNNYKQRSSLDILVLSQKNAGPAVARNLGVSQSKGDYIAFLDADDHWDTDKIATDASYLANSNYKILVSNVNLVDNAGVVIRSNNNDYSNDSSEVCEKLFLGKLSMMTPTLVIERELFKKLGGFSKKLRYKEDHLLILKAVDYSGGLGFYTACKTNVRIHEGSMRNNINYFRLLRGYLNFEREVVSFKPELKKLRHIFRSFLYFSIAKSYSSSSKKRSFYWVVKSLKEDPKNIKAIILLFLLPFGVDKNSLVKIKSMLRGVYVRKG
ncbi:glycosyltransferase family 2 protein [Vibrio crassostreae]|uniref:glycosyltransferase family 2 protein n=1 Tax=Vibrio crassostreae TaxID=246167 RepID=UPI000F50ACDD|nr:glycosyltransferase family A protein [Vibrio crassostreae]RPF12623.1 glycosyltransferase involved in cell wall biosynthesis [Vibrio crassostreae]